MSTAFSDGMLYLNRYERQQIGLNWDNIWSSPMYYPDQRDQSSYGAAVLFNLFDAILYLGLASSIIYWRGYFTLLMSA